MFTAFFLLYFLGFVVSCAIYPIYHRIIGLLQQLTTLLSLIRMQPLVLANTPPAPSSITPIPIPSSMPMRPTPVLCTSRRTPRWALSTRFGVLEIRVRVCRVRARIASLCIGLSVRIFVRVVDALAVSFAVR